MPYQMKKVGNQYAVINKDTGAYHAKHTSKKKAVAQMKLLRGIEHGMKKK